MADFSTDLLADLNITFQNKKLLMGKVSYQNPPTGSKISLKIFFRQLSDCIKGSFMPSMLKLIIFLYQTDM